VPTAYRLRYFLPEKQPSVTLIIPTYNNLRVLKNCIESIQQITEYREYEILIIDNRTDDPEALRFLELCQSDSVRVIKYSKNFNFSAINNFAVTQTQSDILVLLNNDTEVCNADWLQEMVSHAIRPEVGAVGAKLFYPQGLIQHAGVILGMGPDKVAGHAFKGVHKHDMGPMARTRLIQAYSAVTAACMAVSRYKYLEVGGLDADNLAIAFNDVDFCLKLQESGYINIWTPYAQLYHYESYSRGYDHSDKIKHERFKQERDYMHRRWGNTLLSDPYYNPNLTKDFDNFGLAWPPANQGKLAATD
jgi:GT2 family glycosyltransferase